MAAGSVIEWLNQYGEWIRFGAGVLIGGAGSALINHWLQSRRSRRDLTLKLIEQYQSLESHKQRQTAWSLFYRPWDRTPTFNDYGNAEREAEAGAFRYVLNFFVQAGALIEQHMLDKELFFALSRRWMLDPYERFLRPSMNVTEADNYVAHKQALVALEKAWEEWRKKKGAT